MRAFVFTDESLTRHAGRFVWLEIDTEKRLNAPLRKKFPVEALPTFFVVDPADEKVALRWVGGATVGQLEQMLVDGRLAVERRGLEQSQLPADQALARADRLYGEGRSAEAAKAYREALALAPAAWPHYARAVEATLFALYRVEDNEAGARLALDALAGLRHTPSAATVVVSGLDLALGLPADNPTRKELVASLESAAREVVADSTLAIAADDRSGVYVSLLDVRKEAQDEAGVREIATRWAAFLDTEAAKAKTPEQRAVFDSHRLSACLELGEPERAIPMLEASERDLPGDYNPPARLAVAYRAMKRWDEALAASDRALAKAYGPRQLGILQTRADIYAGKGDREAARRTLEQALRTAVALPPEQRSENTLAALRKRLESMK